MLCVYCRARPEAPEWRPFCSERCKMADLGRWLGGEYRVPVDDPDGEAPPLTGNTDDDDETDADQ
jgi:endogenous inhibitor of DNA gyrase (YacG/DUF329 family)